jgi:hypothetical protein
VRILRYVDSCDVVMSGLNKVNCNLWRLGNLVRHNGLTAPHTIVHAGNKPKPQSYYHSRDLPFDSLVQGSESSDPHRWFLVAFHSLYADEQTQPPPA